MTPSPAPTSAPAAAAAPRRLDLQRLDDALVQVRRLLHRPGYRRRLRASLPDDVELTTLRVLRAVERAEDAAPTSGDVAAPSIGDVAETLDVDPSTASRFIETAHADGLLDRRTCERDRRRSRLYLTPDGRDLLGRATLARREVLAEVTDGWSDEEVATLGALLERLRDGFARLEAQP